MLAIQVACASMCVPGEFLCSEGRCIPGSRACDGDRDCGQGEDEVAGGGNTWWRPVDTDNLIFLLLTDR